MRYLISFLSLLAIGAAPAALGDCLSQCMVELVDCRSRPQPGESVCFSAYARCIEACYDGSGGGIPVPALYGFGNVTVGTLGYWQGRFSHRWGDVPFRGGKATLVASWTPPLAGQLGSFSPPELGPFKLSLGQRWELQWGEGQNVGVAFVPDRMGTAGATLYLWWERDGHFRWAETIDFFGTGMDPPPPPPPQSGRTPGRKIRHVRCCDGTFSPTCTYVHAGCCSKHGGVCP